MDASERPAVAGDASKARFFAFFADQFIVVGLMILAAAVVPAEYPSARWINFIGIYVAYFLVLEAVWSRTPGKFFQGLVIRKLDGSPCGWKEALIRFALRVIEINPLLFGGLPAGIAILITKRRQRVGDFLAGTVVVRTGVHFGVAGSEPSPDLGSNSPEAAANGPPKSSSTMIAHLWLGQFGPEAPEDFFEERYDREDDEPLSQFAASQGETWYDHDFVEISYLDEMGSVRSLVEGHSYCESYLDSIVAKAATLGIDRVNVFVFADKEQCSSPRSARGPGYQLWYLGEFECRIK
jgi:uncharacterized RDD family membrane protein YckC